MKKTTQRSILMMENGCKSPYTRNVYRHRSNQWVEYLGMDLHLAFVFDELVKISIV